MVTVVNATTKKAASLEVDDDGKLRVTGSGGGGGGGDASLSEQEAQTALLTTIASNTGNVTAGGATSDKQDEQTSALADILAAIIAAMNSTNAKLDDLIAAVLSGTPPSGDDVITYGVYSARPAAGSGNGVDKAVYVATDVREVYISDGAAWNIMSASSQRAGPFALTNQSNLSSTAVEIPSSITSVVAGEATLVSHIATRLLSTPPGGVARLEAWSGGSMYASFDVDLSNAAGQADVYFEAPLSGFTPGSSYTFSWAVASVDNTSQIDVFSDSIASTGVVSRAGVKATGL